MTIKIKPYSKEDAVSCAEIWNEVVEDGMSFPQENDLDADSADKFFFSQSFTGVAFELTKEGTKIVGLYILHPNNIGRCGHLANASYAVKKIERGKHIGELLVRHSVKKCSELGFRILQFNAVVATNESALHLYKKIGFTRLGTIPGGFRDKNGNYLDIIPHYIKTDKLA